MLKLRNQKGFTLVELMIATAVFSLVLMVLFASVIYVGRTYYRGVTLTRTSDVASAAIKEVSDSIKLTSIKERTLGPSGGWEALCLGNTKYSYKFNNLKDNAADSVFVASEDLACNSPVPTAVNRRELLEQNMRLIRFNVTTDPISNLVQVQLKIASGGDPAISGLDDTQFNKTAGEIVSCKTGVAGSEFCAVSDLSVVVFRRIN